MENVKRSDYNLEFSSEDEKNVREAMYHHFKECPIPDNQILSNLGMFLNSKTLSRILFMEHIYKQIVEIPGIVIEFGTRWGQNMSLFSALRGIYEPFNRHRKIVGFDTFTGFPALDKKDGNSEMMWGGGFNNNPRL